VDEQLAAKIRKQIDAAEAKVIDLQERQAGAHLASCRAQGEVDAWRTEHVGQLLDEIAPAAHTAAENITARVAELEEARQSWHQTADRVSALVRGSIDPKAIPSLDRADSAVREPRRDIGDVPVPLPRELGAATVVPMHDADPAARESARAAITEQAG
jgi:hypothetical protein